MIEREYAWCSILGLCDRDIDIYIPGLTVIKCYPSHIDHCELMSAYLFDHGKKPCHVFAFSPFDGQLIWYDDKAKTPTENELSTLQNYIDNHWKEVVDTFIRAYRYEPNVDEFLSVRIDVTERKQRSYYPEKAPVLHCYQPIFTPDSVIAIWSKILFGYILYM